MRHARSPRRAAGWGSSVAVLSAALLVVGLTGPAAPADAAPEGPAGSSEQATQGQQPATQLEGAGQQGDDVQRTAAASEGDAAEPMATTTPAVGASSDEDTGAGAAQQVGGAAAEPTPAQQSGTEQPADEGDQSAPGTGLAGTDEAGGAAGERGGAAGERGGAAGETGDAAGERDGSTTQEADAADAGSDVADHDPATEEAAGTDGSSSASPMSLGATGMQPMSVGSATDDWELELDADPHDSSDVEPGETITYTLTASQDSAEKVTGANATVDLTDVLDNADLVTPLESGLSRSGNELSWDVPTIECDDWSWFFGWACWEEGSNKVSFEVKVHESAIDGIELSATAKPNGNGDCVGWGNSNCTVSHEVDVPQPATITVHAGGIRTGDNAVDPLPDGAVFQAVPDTDTPPAGGPWTCEATDGSCTIEVPGGYDWDVSELTPPSGWYLSEDLDIGDPPSASDYAFHVGDLEEGDSVDVPGSSSSGGYHDDTWRSGAQFGGLLATSLDNPTVPQQCGLNIALVLDQSGSMADGFTRWTGSEYEYVTKQDLLKDASANVIDALTGTPSNLAIYTFDEDAGPRISLTSTATAASAEALHDFIDDLGTPTNGTNWDQGLWQVADEASSYDMVVFVTDGAPTIYGPDADGDGNRTDFRYVERGMFSANAIKAAGPALIGLGIEIGNAADNLRAVTGPVEGTDYFLGSGSTFGTTLEELAAGACSGTLTIQKDIETWDGDLLEESPAANGWDFTGSISGSGNGIGTFPATHEVNGQNGYTSTEVTIVPGSQPTITVTEQLTDGYTFRDAICTVDGDEVDVEIVHDADEPSVSFTGAANASMACTFINRQPRPAHTLTVQKTWVDALTGDQTTMTVTNAGASAAAGTSTANGDQGAWTDTAHQVTAQIPEGTAVELAEVLAEENTGVYDSALSCDSGVSVTAGTFQMPDEDVTCTFTNTRLVPGMTVVKRAWTTPSYDLEIATGSPVVSGTYLTWTYEVTNTGETPLTGITVADDQVTNVSCPSTSLAVDASMTCTASGPVTALATTP